MGKYQYGGYCPKCVQPVNAFDIGMGCALIDSGRGIMCCPECGETAPGMPMSSGGYFIQWPQAPIRITGALWWKRWEVLVPSEAKP